MNELEGIPLNANGEIASGKIFTKEIQSKQQNLANQKKVAAKGKQVYQKNKDTDLLNDPGIFHTSNPPYPPVAKKLVSSCSQVSGEVL